MEKETTAKDVSHQSMLDELIRMFYEVLKEREGVDAKIGDFMKMIELRRKLAPGDDDQKEFWKMIDEIRRSRSDEGKANRKPKKRTAATGQRSKK